MVQVSQTRKDDDGPERGEAAPGPSAVEAPPAAPDGERTPLAMQDDDGDGDDIWHEIFEADVPGEEELADASTGSVNSESHVSELVSRLCSVDLCEAFSPPGVGQEAVKFGMSAGDAMELTTGWGFNKKEDRERAE